MNTFKFVRCSKNDVRVQSMFDKMVFDPSLINWSKMKFLLLEMGFPCQGMKFIGDDSVNGHLSNDLSVL